MDTTKYRRLSPTLRLSWTAFHMWESGKWDPLKDYLLDREQFTSVAMERGSELHEFADKSDYLPLPPGVSKPTKSISELKIELPRVGGVAVGVIDKLLFFNDSSPVIIDYKSGKLYPYYKKQIQFYCAIASLHYGQSVDTGFLIPIKWEDDDKQAIVAGEPQMIYTKKHQEMIKQIDSAIFDILFRIDGGWLDE